MYLDGIYSVRLLKSLCGKMVYVGLNFYNGKGWPLAT